MFNDIIVENFSNPTFAEELPDASVVMELGNPVCGDRIRVQLQLADGLVQKARYQAWGCATSLATGNIFCGYLEAKPIADVVSTPDEHVEHLMGELEPSQHHCLEMLRALFEQLRQKTAAAS